jgi:hypothetical protein
MGKSAEERRPRDLHCDVDQAFMGRLEKKARSTFLLVCRVLVRYGGSVCGLRKYWPPLVVFVYADAKKISHIPPLYKAKAPATHPLAKGHLRVGESSTRLQLEARECGSVCARRRDVDAIGHDVPPNSGTAGTSEMHSLGTLILRLIAARRFRSNRHQQ